MKSKCGFLYTGEMKSFASKMVTICGNYNNTVISIQSIKTRYNRPHNQTRSLAVEMVGG